MTLATNLGEHHRTHDYINKNMVFDIKNYQLKILQAMKKLENNREIKIDDYVIDTHYGVLDINNIGKSFIVLLLILNNIRLDICNYDIEIDAYGTIIKTKCTLKSIKTNIIIIPPDKMYKWQALIRATSLHFLILDSKNKCNQIKNMEEIENYDVVLITTSMCPNCKNMGCFNNYRYSRIIVDNAFDNTPINISNIKSNFIWFLSNTNHNSNECYRKLKKNYRIFRNVCIGLNESNLIRYPQIENKQHIYYEISNDNLKLYNRGKLNELKYALNFHFINKITSNIIKYNIIKENIYRYYNNFKTLCDCIKKRAHDIHVFECFLCYDIHNDIIVHIYKRLTNDCDKFIFSESDFRNILINNLFYNMMEWMDGKLLSNKTGICKICSDNNREKNLTKLFVNHVSDIMDEFIKKKDIIMANLIENINNISKNSCDICAENLDYPITLYCCGNLICLKCGLCINNVCPMCRSAYDVNKLNVINTFNIKPDQIMMSQDDKLQDIIEKNKTKKILVVCKYKNIISNLMKKYNIYIFSKSANSICNFYEKNYGDKYNIFMMQTYMDIDLPFINDIIFCNKYTDLQKKKFIDIVKKIDNKNNSITIHNMQPDNDNNNDSFDDEFFFNDDF